MAAPTPHSSASTSTSTTSSICLSLITSGGRRADHRRPGREGKHALLRQHFDVRPAPLPEFDADHQADLPHRAHPGRKPRFEALPEARAQHLRALVKPLRFHEVDGGQRSRAGERLPPKVVPCFPGGGRTRSSPSTAPSGTPPAIPLARQSMSGTTP